MKDDKWPIKFFGVALLSFTAILFVCEIGVAVANYILGDTVLRSYTITLVVIPVISLLFTMTVFSMLYVTRKKTGILVESLDKVAGGDYSVKIEVKRGDTFASVYENFNKMTRELSSVKTLREDFVHELSHEIKTPLASIHGFAKLLSEGGVSEDEQKKLLQIIADEAVRVRKLADGVLTLSKLENQQLVSENKNFRLDLQVTDCIIMLERDWESKNIDISSELEPVSIEGDSGMLTQVWLNLLSNAIKFTPEGGKIEIKLRRENGFAAVTVKDNGAGVAEEDIPHLFDKYYRAPTAESTDGNGLGLTICKRICTLAGGRITVTSKRGEGSVFKVLLPLGK